MVLPSLCLLPHGTPADMVRFVGGVGGLMSMASKFMG